MVRKMILCAMVAAMAAGVCAAEGVPGGKPLLYGQDSCGYFYSYNNNYGYVSDTFEDGLFGMIEADLDGDGKVETITIDMAAAPERREYYGDICSDYVLRMNVYESDGSPAAQVKTDIDHITASINIEFEDDIVPGEKVYSGFKRAYLYGDAPYIMIESYELESTRGDGRTLNVEVYRYRNGQLEPVLIIGKCGSDLVLVDPEYITGLAGAGIGCVDTAYWETYAGLIQSIENTIPIAGSETVTLVSYEEESEWNPEADGPLKVTKTHIFDREELENGVLYTKRNNAEHYREDFAAYYSDGMVRALRSTAIRRTPFENGDALEYLQEKDEVGRLSEFTYTDDTGRDWYCVVCGDTYGWAAAEDMEAAVK